MEGGGENLGYSVRGWHRLLCDLGIPVDFLEVSELGADRAGHYKALILPFPLSLSEEVADKLCRYVERGGQLIGEACPGRINEHACCTRGELSPTMASLFGVSHESLTMVREPGGGRRWSPRERTWGEYLDATMLIGAGPLAGQRVRANVYVETYVPQDGVPCLHYGEAVAGGVRRLGKGSAWLLGTLIGHCGTAYRDEESRAMVAALMAQCGVAVERRGELLLRRRVGRAKEAWVLTNPLNHEVTEQFDVQRWSLVADLLGEPIKREGDQVAVTVKSLDVRVLVLQASQAGIPATPAVS